MHSIWLGGAAVKAFCEDDCGCAYTSEASKERMRRCALIVICQGVYLPLLLDNSPALSKPDEIFQVNCLNQGC